ncbi:hypothetical protein EG328_005668 [Venturia inaequalis]|uniref:Uncharacterized protein n=1 Tax=Venturia inaequalis TaxID=5025 RepID=A0A8H3ZAL2_VENIN|nr:hypothetical protein EG328_005668 [Venturia inaequalis]
MTSRWNSNHCRTRMQEDQNNLHAIIRSAARIVIPFETSKTGTYAMPYKEREAEASHCAPVLFHTAGAKSALPSPLPAMKTDPWQGRRNPPDPQHIIQTLIL